MNDAINSILSVSTISGDGLKTGDKVTMLVPARKFLWITWRKAYVKELVVTSVTGELRKGQTIIGPNGPIR